MKARLHRLLASLLLAGCAPSVPTGGFRCSDSDQACPSGQHCACGLCVAHDNEAACSFDVQVDTDTVHEHQPLGVAITARAHDGTPAGGFNGSVSLDFRLPDGTHWADVRPPSLTLQGGSARASITINRETIPPQAPRLDVEFAGQHGSSDPIHVLAPTFTKEATPIATTPFGWASTVVSWASVIHDGTQFRMYFTGVANNGRPEVGLALSPDGKTFMARPDVVFPAPGSLFPQNAVIVSASPFQTVGGWNLAFYAQDMAGTPLDIGLATSTDGLGVFDLANGGNPILTRAACGSYCSSTAWFPSVIQIPTGAAPAWLMFFTAVRCNQAGGGCNGFSNVSMSVGRAGSADGVHYLPEPAPVLSGDTGGEAYLATPQVFLDGTVYKMYYGFTHSLGVSASPCDPGARVEVGYATSSDGFYWVRSPSNPLVTVGGSTWDAAAPGLVVSSVVPADGRDPESGLLLFYAPFAAVPFPPFCVPSGIGRAVGQ